MEKTLYDEKWNSIQISSCYFLSCLIFDLTLKLQIAVELLAALSNLQTEYENESKDKRACSQAECLQIRQESFKLNAMLKHFHHLFLSICRRCGHAGVSCSHTWSRRTSSWTSWNRSWTRPRTSREEQRNSRRLWMWEYFSFHTR